MGSCEVDWVLVKYMVREVDWIFVKYLDLWEVNQK